MNINRTNLEKLATYLEALPADYAHFNMGLFFGGVDGPDGVPTHCGTSACAVGHGPYAGIPAHRGENWADYSHRVFFDTCEDEMTLDQSYAWDVMFSARWDRWDNSVKGAAKRIRWVLANPTSDELRKVCHGVSFGKIQIISDFLKEIGQ